MTSFEALLFRADDIEIQELQWATDQWLHSNVRHGALKCTGPLGDGRCKRCFDLYDDFHYAAKLLAVINDEPFPRKVKSMDFRPTYAK